MKGAFVSISPVFSIVSGIVAGSILIGLALLRAWVEAKRQRRERIPVPVIAEEAERRQRSARLD
jgi:hypothetical protein